MNAQNTFCSIEKTSFSLKSMLGGVKAKAQEIYQAPIVTNTAIVTPALEEAEATLKEIHKARQVAIDAINATHGIQVAKQKAAILKIQEKIVEDIAAQGMSKTLSEFGSAVNTLTA